MACNTIPLSCLTPSRIFAGVYKPNCAGFGDPSSFQAEQAIFNSVYGEQINNYGVTIGYYVNVFDIENMNNVYGEHTLMYWLGPVDIKAYVELQEESPIYSIAGFDSPDTVTVYIQIDNFTSKFQNLSVFNNYLVTENLEPILQENGELIYVDGENRIFKVEPKAQDKIIIYPLGCDRVNGRGAKIFEVTEALDQTTDINPMMGHYVWKIKAVRSEFNSTTNEPREKENNQISDSTFFGKLSSALFPDLVGEEKRYSKNADAEVIDEIMPPSTSGNSGSVYGNYY